MSTHDTRCSPLELLIALRDPTITPYQAKLLAIYRSYGGKEPGSSFPGDKTVAKHMGIKRRQLQKHRTPLLDRGLLEQRLNAGPNGQAVYRVILDPQEQSHVANKRSERRADGHRDDPSDDALMGTEGAHPMGTQGAHQEAPMGTPPTHRRRPQSAHQASSECPSNDSTRSVDGHSEGTTIEKGVIGTSLSTSSPSRESLPSLVPSHAHEDAHAPEGAHKDSPPPGSPDDPPTPSGPRPDDEGYFRCGCGTVVGGPRVLCVACREGGTP